MANNPRSTTGGEFANVGESFSVSSIAPAVSFATVNIDPPAPAYVGVNDRLLVQNVGSANGQLITINVLMLRPDGQIIPLKFTQSQNLGRTENRQTFQLMEGFILSATATIAVIAANDFSCFVALSLVRAPFSDLDIYHVLYRGYINDTFGCGYPQDAPQRSTDGAGVLTSNQVGNPAAGADWVYTVPAGARQRLMTATGLLTTAVAVANRIPSLIIDDGVNVLANIPTGVTQVASLADTYTFGDGLVSSVVTGGIVMTPTPGNLFLRAGWRVRSSTAGIQAADQWSAISLGLVEWIEV